jgi:hypothetical protein
MVRDHFHNSARIAGCLLLLVVGLEVGRTDLVLEDTRGAAHRPRSAPQPDPPQDRHGGFVFPQTAQTIPTNSTFDAKLTHTDKARGATLRAATREGFIVRGKWSVEFRVVANNLKVPMLLLGFPGDLRIFLLPRSTNPQQKAFMISKGPASSIR